MLSRWKKSRAFYDYYKIPESKLYFMPYAVDNEYFFTQRKALPKNLTLKKDWGIRIFLSFYLPQS